MNAPGEMAYQSIRQPRNSSICLFIFRFERTYVRARVSYFFWSVQLKNDLCISLCYFEYIHVLTF